MADAALAGQPRGAFGSTGRVQRAAGLDEKDFAGRRQLHAAIVAVHQRGVQIALQLLNLLAEGRLSDADARGRMAKVQGLGQGNEVAVQAKLYHI